MLKLPTRPSIAVSVVGVNTAVFGAQIDGAVAQQHMQYVVPLVGIYNGVHVACAVYALEDAEFPGQPYLIRTYAQGMVNAAVLFLAFMQGTQLLRPCRY